MPQRAIGVVGQRPYDRDRHQREARGAVQEYGREQGAQDGQGEGYGQDHGDCAPDGTAAQGLAGVRGQFGFLRRRLGGEPGEHAAADPYRLGACGRWEDHAASAVLVAVAEAAGHGAYGGAAARAQEERLAEYDAAQAGAFDGDGAGGQQAAADAEGGGVGPFQAVVPPVFEVENDGADAAHRGDREQGERDGEPQGAVAEVLEGVADESDLPGFEAHGVQDPVGGAGHGEDAAEDPEGQRREPQPARVESGEEGVGVAVRAGAGQEFGAQPLGGGAGEGFQAQFAAAAAAAGRAGA